MICKREQKGAALFLPLGSPPPISKGKPGPVPIIVDRKERREMVTSIAFDLVAEIGIEALTFKQIATAAGYSTAIVSNYFHNKNELLFKVYEVANTRSRERLEAAFEAGLPLLDCFETVLPVSAESQKNWRVWLAFWGRVHLDPLYAAERSRAARDSLALYRRMLAVRCGDAQGNCAFDLDMASHRLLALIAGTALEACFDPEGWPPKRMRAVIRSELDRLA